MTAHLEHVKTVTVSGEIYVLISNDALTHADSVVLYFTDEQILQKCCYEIVLFCNFYSKYSAF